MDTISILGPHVFFALPTYNGQRYNSMALLDAQHSLRSRVQFYEIGSSLLAFGFNKALATALNLRKKGVTHFLLLHADVMPLEPAWILTLLDEMERVHAQVLSVVIPMKDNHGFTSTAIDNGGWTQRRLTMTEIMQRSETWTEPGLLLNTGCMLLDLRDESGKEPWFEQVHFEINDRIVRTADGEFQAIAEPEDWNFSRQCNSLGVRLFATRKVKVDHVGTMPFPNYQVWGLPTDPSAPSAMNPHAQTSEPPRSP